MKTDRYANKRQRHRKAGKFHKPTAAEYGLGTCQTCSHITIRIYDGDQNDPHPDPRNFRQACPHCEPQKFPATPPEPTFSLEKFFKLP